MIPCPYPRYLTNSHGCCDCNREQNLRMIRGEMISKLTLAQTNTPPNASVDMDGWTSPTTVRVCGGRTLFYVFVFRRQTC